MTRRQLLRLGAAVAVAPSLPVPAIPAGWIIHKTLSSIPNGQAITIRWITVHTDGTRNVEVIRYPPVRDGWALAT